MNSYQFSLGSKGSSFLFVRDEFQGYQNQFVNNLDALLFLAKYREPVGTIWSGRNHTYKFRIGGRLRFQVASYNHWAYFIGSDATGWAKELGGWEAKVTLRMNVFRRGLDNFAGFYYSYHIYDTYANDNESNLGSLGFQVVF